MEHQMNQWYWFPTEVHFLEETWTTSYAVVVPAKNKDDAMRQIEEVASKFSPILQRLSESETLRGPYDNELLAKQAADAYRTQKNPRKPVIV